MLMCTQGDSAARKEPQSAASQRLIIAESRSSAGGNLNQSWA
jgi:hypothetical protein